MCDCIRISITIDGETTSYDLTFVGTYDGQNYWQFTFGITTYFIYYDATFNRWILGDALGISDPAEFWATLPGELPMPNPAIGLLIRNTPVRKRGNIYRGNRMPGTLRKRGPNF
jgi:hypothetical protein